jgi:uncharacterized BrkB/YihY/UPF0761 family membrane protein
MQETKGEQAGGHTWVGRKRPASVWALLVVVAIQALGATAGGIGLVQDPVNNIGMPLSMLEGSPFSDYLIPGLILLVVVGLFPLCVLYGLIRRRRWAWWLALAAGAALIVWIVTEGILLGYLPGSGIGLQITMGLVGVLILLFTLVRPTRRFYDAVSWR